MEETNAPAKILLVDDEPVIRETLCAILKEDGYQVLTASTGREAISVGREEFFDVAIIDLKLPDVEGTYVLHCIKETNPTICSILITAYPTTESAIRAIQEEAYEYITKPFDISHVKLVIKRGLEERKLEYENNLLLSNLKSEKEKLETMLQIGRAMSSILNLEELARFIVTKITDVLRARVCSLMLIDDDDALVIKAAVGLEPGVVKDTRMKLGQPISGWVAQQGDPVRVTDIEKDMQFGRTSLPKYETKSLLCIPLKIKDRILGVINVADKSGPGKNNVFSEEDLGFLGIICNYAAIAVENALLYGEVKNLAITDGLTTLFNHQYFQTHLSVEVARVQRYAHPLSLIMFDIDSFKAFNDTYGHPMGDGVLSQIAKIVKKNVRQVDIACRYGGEEFAIILPETKLNEAVVVAEKIRKSVEEVAFVTGQNTTKKKMTISGGVAQLASGMTKEDLVRAADNSLYEAKSSGKNKICVHSV
ncbi:MAG: diguanylate cyclase [Candidatus Omnitrophica bacterium]|jgi:diguanylate cyclase (GGDEF) domain|nr:diguanylate cyclase [Candidatus Omnitrophota bacterium]